MKIHCLGDNWILTRMGHELADVTEFPDIDYYIPYSQFIKNQENRTSVVLFTHYESVNHVRFSTAASLCHHAIAMSEQTAEDVLKYRSECYVIEGGTDMPKRELTFGVVGRTYPSGRKGEYLIENMVRAGYKVLGLGQGWPCEIYAEDNTNEKYTTELREEYYSQIDYLIVPSLIEGGPIPVLDALAYGVPVIAPDVGWCWDYSVIKYETGSWESLKAVLEGLNPPSWQEWKEHHLKVFQEIYEKSGKTLQKS